jgi:hypothetical protein
VDRSGEKPELIDRVVMTVDGRYVGSVGYVWGDTSAATETFLGIRALGTGGLPHLLPLSMCLIEGAFVRTPFTCEQIRAAPRADPHEELDAQTVDEVQAHYTSARQSVSVAQ